jgi:hypothetical protein
MNQTPPYDPTALIVEPTDPSSAASRRAGPRRRAIPLFASAVALLLTGGVGGYLLAHSGSPEASLGPVDPAASAAFDPSYGYRGHGGPGDPGGFGPGRPGGFHWGTGGTIDSVNGTTIMLTTRDGRKVTVTAAGTVPVTLRSQGSVADLKPGQTIIVSGRTSSDGSVTADRIAVGTPR